MDRPEKVLIIRPSALGDVCRTVPVLASLRRAYPDAVIDWVVQDTFAPAITSHPALNEAIAFPRKDLGRWWSRKSGVRELVGWFADVRRRRYDVVLDCQGLSRSGLMALVSGAGKRVGLGNARELAWLGYNRKAAPPSNAHAVDVMLSLLPLINVEPVADMTLYTAAADQQWLGSSKAATMAATPTAVLAPTSRWESKSWPAERWVAFIDALPSLGLEQAIIIGAPNEREQLAPIRAALDAKQNDVNVIDIAGETTIGQTMAVIEQAALVIANDSAPLHMAVGFDVPFVGLFGPTDPAIVGPYNAMDAVVRADGIVTTGKGAVHYRDRGLGDSLMRAIEVDEVAQCAQSMMSRHQQRRAAADGLKDGLAS